MFEHRILTQLFALNENVNVVRSFPGALPISLSEHTLRTCLPFGYVCSLKANGSRAFLFIIRDVEGLDIVYTYDRGQNITNIRNSVTTGHTAEFEDLLGKLVSSTVTVLDVETIGKNILAFDALCIENVICTNYCYSERHHMLARYVDTMVTRNGDDPQMCDDAIAHAWGHLTTPTLTTNKDHVACVHVGNGHKLSVKPIFPTSSVGQMWTEYDNKGCVQMEGVVFTRLRNRYEPYRCDAKSVIKWKDGDDNTVDFMVDTTQSSVGLCCVYGIPSHYTSQTVGNVVLSCESSSETGKFLNVSYGNVPDQLVGQCRHTVCEFKYVGAAWQFVMMRKEKSRPNSMETFKRTLESITESLTISCLSSVLGNG